ncbi:MAG: ABC transporter substrate-binding protein [Candidatus Ancillula trichonymphae]|nr:ABC transporter substrate-binding protein [Candidatus Ancillula trichonymphae]
MVKTILRTKLQVSLLLAVAVMSTGVLTACGTNSSNNNSNGNASGSLKSTTLIVPDGAPLLSVASLVEGGALNSSSGVFQVGDDVSKELGAKVGIQVVQDSDTLVANIKKERPELAVVPINLAAKLYNENATNKESQYRLLGVSTWGLNQVVANFNISSLKDLVGKKLYSFAKSGVPGITIRALLKKEGIAYADFKDTVSATAVNIVDFTAAPDIVAELPKNLYEQHVALLSEPVASAFEIKTQGKYFSKLDLQVLIAQAFNGLKYPQAGLVVRSDILDDASCADFLNKFTASIAKTAPALKENAEQVVVRTKENFKSAALASTAAVVSALKGGRLDVEFVPVFDQHKSGEEKIKQDVKALLQIIQDSGASALIGGKVPDDKFFALDKN